MIGTPDFLQPRSKPATRCRRGGHFAPMSTRLGGTLYYLLTGRVPLRRRQRDREDAETLHRPATVALAVPPGCTRCRCINSFSGAWRRKPRNGRQTPLQLAQRCIAVLPAASSGRHRDVRRVGFLAHVPPRPPRPAAQTQPPAPPQYPLPGYPPGYPQPPVYAPPGHATTALARPKPEQPGLQDCRHKTTDERPARRRSEGKFPVGPILIVLGRLFVVGVLAYATYRLFPQHALGHAGTLSRTRKA